MKPNSIFLVSLKNLDSIEMVEVAFDTRAKAEAYANRYKTNQDPDITEVPVNPVYHSDPTVDCYYLEIDSEKVVECHISDTMESSEMALNKSFRKLRYPYQNIVCTAVFAETEEKAIEQGYQFLKRPDVALILH
jgi:hypothetical protein